jgi:hypothetical protein
MAKPLILYSTNSWLAYMIAEKFYGSEHFVWCTPVFDARSLSAYTASVPPTSCPAEIYRNLYEEVRRKDRHSVKIQENKAGIVRGAGMKNAAGDISAEALKEIGAIVEQAELADFKPLLYVIPFDPVAKLVKEVPVAKKAHPLSEEYTIERLPRLGFDILEFLP